MLGKYETTDPQGKRIKKAPRMAEPSLVCVATLDINIETLLNAPISTAYPLGHWPNDLPVPLQGGDRKTTWTLATTYDSLSHMPVVLRYNGYRFFFYSNEGDPREPLHIHVRKGECLAKIWLNAWPEVAESYKLSAQELRELLDVAVSHKDEIARCWNEYFGS